MFEVQRRICTGTGTTLKLKISNRGQYLYERDNVRTMLQFYNKQIFEL